MAEFVLHPGLEADTVFVCDWALCRVLVMKDARFPWLILVPRREAAVELHDLSAADRAVLIEEAVRAGVALKRLTGAAKLNTGALGNVVPQLHVHVIARHLGDAAWPGPVWGRGVAEPYAPEALAAFLERLGTAVAP